MNSILKINKFLLIIFVGFMPACQAFKITPLTLEQREQHECWLAEQEERWRREDEERDWRRRKEEQRQREELLRQVNERMEQHREAVLRQIEEEHRRFLKETFGL
ncbi:MAG: hypothetical protein LBU70_00740 [Chitinispirillales bacterium]|jgi:hypothetical protein|nr:hypothetical protein [Chitinispirillales bacterium]